MAQNAKGMAHGAEGVGAWGRGEGGGTYGMKNADFGLDLLNAGKLEQIAWAMRRNRKFDSVSH